MLYPFVPWMHALVIVPQAFQDLCDQQRHLGKTLWHLQKCYDGCDKNNYYLLTGAWWLESSAKSQFAVVSWFDTGQSEALIKPFIQGGRLFFTMLWVPPTETWFYQDCCVTCSMGCSFQRISCSNLEARALFLCVWQQGPSLSLSGLPLDYSIFWPLLALAGAPFPWAVSAFLHSLWTSWVIGGQSVSLSSLSGLAEEFRLWCLEHLFPILLFTDHHAAMCLFTCSHFLLLLCS